jgi:hypothetical protein
MYDVKPEQLSGEKWGNWKEKLMSLKKNRMNKNMRDLYRDINEFKKSYQPRNDFVKDENGNLLADCHNILKIWKNYFCQLLNVHGVNDARQTNANSWAVSTWT